MNSEDVTTEIYLVRHGQTDWNRQNLIQGHKDIPLNQTGIKQATGLSRNWSQVSFSSAYSSDLSRAQHTAEIILQPHSITVITTPFLRERNSGRLEGLDRDQYEAEIRPFFLSEMAQNRENYIHSQWHPEIETTHSVYHRVTEFLFSITANPSTNKPILVVSHGGVLRAILDHFSFTPNKRWVIENCGFIKVKVKKREIELVDSHCVSQRLIC